MISVLILTKNEEQDLPGCLESVAWSDDVHLFDSFSTDNTLQIARAAGCIVTQRVFDNWASHQNWGLANIPFKYPWVFYIDADERLSPELRDAALAAAKASASESAFELRRRDFYGNGRWLKHAQISPFYLRLFRPNKMRYERLVNPVSIVDGSIGKIDGYLDHYPFSKGVGFWIERHIKYAELEARIIVERKKAGAEFSLKKALWSRDFTSRRYHQKQLFYSLFLRPLVKYIYMVVVRRAFLDGRAGLNYAALQSIYEYFIVLKQVELELAAQKTVSSETSKRNRSIAAALV